jgi:TatD DNase family protein
MPHTSLSTAVSASATDHLLATDPCSRPYVERYALIDTHTHFDDSVFVKDREAQIRQASDAGVQHLVLVGYLRRYFERMWQTQAQINTFNYPGLSQQEVSKPLQAHVALGLHPVYIDEHTVDDLQVMTDGLNQRNDIIAIGEIGLDTFTPQLKLPEVLAKQQRCFIAQLDMAVSHELPVLLHIRKAHAETLKILKQHPYDAHTLGGIAHSFSGGEQEAKAFVALGFKLGVTGQVTNPNAKKLRRALAAAVQQYGLSCLVIETDCPDMLPVMCQPDWSATAANNLETSHSQPTRNTPANLPHVLATLSELFDIALADLAEQLWRNSCEALKVQWDYTASH